MSWSRCATWPASSSHIACSTPRSTILCMLWKLICRYYFVRLVTCQTEQIRWSANIIVLCVKTVSRQPNLLVRLRTIRFDCQSLRFILLLKYQQLRRTSANCSSWSAVRRPKVGGHVLNEEWFRVIPVSGDTFVRRSTLLLPDVAFPTMCCCKRRDD